MKDMKDMKAFRIPELAPTANDGKGSRFRDPRSDLRIREPFQSRAVALGPGNGALDRCGPLHVLRSLHFMLFLFSLLESLFYIGVWSELRPSTTPRRPARRGIGRAP